MLEFFAVSLVGLALLILFIAIFRYFTGDDQ